MKLKFSNFQKELEQNEQITKNISTIKSYYFQLKDLYIGFIHNMSDLKEVELNFLDIFNLLLALNYKLKDEDLPCNFHELMKYFLIENYNKKVVKDYLESDNKVKHYRLIIKFFDLFLKEQVKERKLGKEDYYEILYFF